MPENMFTNVIFMSYIFVEEKEGQRNSRKRIGMKGKEGKGFKRRGKGIGDQIRKGLEGRIENMGWVEEGIWIKKEGW